MCGILGILSHNQHNINPAIAKQVLNSLNRRGPDAEGFWPNTDNTQHNKLSLTANQIFLGHRRLAINELGPDGAQPMVSLCGNFVLIFNGEIYNHKELRQELTLAGYQFRSQNSDSEVLLNSYIAWKEKSLDKLVGMFAFAILELSTKTLIIARDRLGQKPLYFSQDHGKFAFSSEIKAILPFSSTSVSPEAVREYIMSGHVSPETSFHRNIKTLPSGFFLKFDLESEKYKLQSYWELGFQRRFLGSQQDANERFEELWTNAVSIRMRSDVPIATLYSGGVDSALVLKGIRDSGNSTHKAFYASFNDENFQPSTIIEKASKLYGADLHCIQVDQSDFKHFNSLINQFDTPFDGASAISQLALFEEVSKHDVKVVLTGDGADEIFGGYERYQAYAGKRPASKLLRLLGVSAALNKIHPNTRVPEKFHATVMKLGTKNSISGYERSLTKLLSLQLTKLSIYEAEKILDELHEITATGDLDFARNILYHETKNRLPSRMLNKLDNTSMYHSIEARAPFMDHRLVEFAFSLPREYHFDQTNRKRILTDLIKKDLGHEFAHQKKIGFGNPLRSWFNDPLLKAHMTQFINDRNSKLYDYIGFSHTQKLVPSLFEDKARQKHIQFAWRLIVLSHVLEKTTRAL